MSLYYLPEGLSQMAKGMEDAFDHLENLKKAGLVKQAQPNCSRSTLPVSVQKSTLRGSAYYPRLSTATNAYSIDSLNTAKFFTDSDGLCRYLQSQLQKENKDENSCTPKFEINC